MLDIETLYFSSAMSRGAFLVVFVVTMWSLPKERYLHHWTLALLASTIGAMLTFGGHGEVLPWLMKPLIYTLFIASLTLSWSGVRLFYDRSVSQGNLLVLSVLPGALYMEAIILNSPERVTLAFTYLSAALVAAMVLREILTAPDRKLLSQYVVAAAFFCYFLALITPAALATFGLMLNANKSERIPMVFDQASSILVYLGYIAMASERANLSLKRQVESDPLTGLANRRGGCRVLRQCHTRLSVGQRCCVLLADIDHFKHINDGLGHEAGDAALVSVAHFLVTELHAGDRAVRWGGEEFLIVLPSTSIGEAIKAAELLRARIEEASFQVAQHRLAITLSVGVAEMDAEDPNFESVIRRADKALYCAKSEGRNRVCSFSHSLH